MSVQFLLLVIAVLLFVIFWELCKINSRLKKTLPTPPRISAGGEAHDAVIAKTVD
jgi:hypothetical protein